MQFQTMSSFPKPAWLPAPPPTPQKKRLKEIFSISGGKLEEAHLLDNFQLSCTIPACHLLDNCHLCCVIPARSEEHTSELQSPKDLVCRLLLEKKKKKREREGGAIISKHKWKRNKDDKAP